VWPGMWIDVEGMVADMEGELILKGQARRLETG